MADTRIPRSADDLTPQWLTEALRPRVPGLAIEAVKVIQIIQGASTKVRLRLRSNREDFPQSVVVKAGFQQHSEGMKYMHRNEMHAYRDLVPTLAVRTPTCYFAGIDENGHSAIVIEDLVPRGVTFLHLQQPIGFALATVFLDRLAAIHTRWWDAPELRSNMFGWVPGTGEGGPSRYLQLLRDPELFARYANAARGAAMPRQLLDPDRIEAGLDAMRAFHNGQPRVINHGDMHLGNLYIDGDGAPGFLDWQPRLAPWSIDVSYFLIAGLDLVDRRRWEAALLQHYLERLAAYGVVPPNFDSAWESYRRDVIWGLLIWLLNSSRFQTEASNTAAATRFAMAMIDHDSFQRLGV